MAQPSNGVSIEKADQGAFQLEGRQRVPLPRDMVFAFFAEPANLQLLTPPWVNFQVLTPLPVTMAAGLLLDYRIRVHGFPLRWRSRITVWDPPLRFVDDQVRGPYREWVHEHRFEDLGDATMVIDRVRFRVLGGPLINKYVVGRDLKRIFGFRQRRLAEVLGF